MMMTVKVMMMTVMMMKYDVSLLILQVGSLVGNDVMIPLLIFRLFYDSSDGIKWYYHHNNNEKNNGNGILSILLLLFCFSDAPIPVLA